VDHFGNQICSQHEAMQWGGHRRVRCTPPLCGQCTTIPWRCHRRWRHRFFFLRHGFSDLVRNRHRHPLSGGTALIFLRRGETEFDTARAPPPLGGSPPGLSGASTVGHRHTLSGARAETAPKGQHLYFVVGVISTSLAGHGHSLGPPNC
jgi:hypothetical protein